jgi:hypothetical protein
MARETFRLEVEVETDGLDSDRLYTILCEKLFEVEGVIDVTDLPNPEFTGEE